MNPELERLSRLADLDDAITARERELEAARAAADEALAARRAEIGAAEVATAPAVDAATAALVELRAERDALRPAIEAHELARYDQLRGRGRRPVSAIVDKACKACRRGLIPHQLHELARGRLERCGGCGRWLLPPE
jgi:predicted  nucleic acid-binding Zn-ribbon protein